jgi:hypothetical protein
MVSGTHTAFGLIIIETLLEGKAAQSDAKHSLSTNA